MVRHLNENKYWTLRLSQCLTRVRAPVPGRLWVWVQLMVAFSVSRRRNGMHLGTTSPGAQNTVSHLAYTDSLENVGIKVSLRARVAI